MGTKRALEFQNFELTKVKRSKDGLTIHYFEKGGQNDSYTVEASGQPHPEFDVAMDALVPFMAKRLNLLAGWDFARQNLKEDEELLKEAISKYEAEEKRCTVSGIAIVGQDQLQAVKITGSLKCDPGSFGLATPNITFASEKLGYEQHVKELCDKISSETYLYLFKNKKAQQDLMDQAEDNEGDGE